MFPLRSPSSSGHHHHEDIASEITQDRLRGYRSMIRRLSPSRNTCVGNHAPCVYSDPVTDNMIDSPDLICNQGLKPSYGPSSAIIIPSEIWVTTRHITGPVIIIIADMHTSALAAR